MFQAGKAIKDLFEEVLIPQDKRRDKEEVCNLIKPGSFVCNADIL